MCDEGYFGGVARPGLTEAKRAEQTTAPMCVPGRNAKESQHVEWIAAIAAVVLAEKPGNRVLAGTT